VFSPGASRPDRIALFIAHSFSHYRHWHSSCSFDARDSNRIRLSHTPEKGMVVPLCCVAPASMAGGPQQPDVNALLRQLDDLYRSKSSIARIEIDVTTTGSTRNRETSTLSESDSHSRKVGGARRRTRQMLG
jgi:hypothetical protein